MYARLRGGLLDYAPTQQEVDSVIDYLFTLKSFTVDIPCRIPLEIVKKFHDAYLRCNKAVNFTLRISKDLYSQEIRMDGKSGLFFAYNTLGITNAATAQEISNILRYCGPQMHTLLEFSNWDDSFRGNSVQADEYPFEDLMDKIIRFYPHLKHLVITGFYLHQCQDTDNTIASIQSIQFDAITFGGIDFFKHLSIRLPNLNDMTISTFSRSVNTIWMPYTSFSRLKILWKRWMSYSLGYREELVLVDFISTTTNKKKDDQGNQWRFKYCCGLRPGDSTTAFSIQKEQEIEKLIELKYKKESPQQADYDEETISLLKTFTFVDIKCASIDSLKLARNDAPQQQQELYTFQINSSSCSADA